MTLHPPPPAIRNPQSDCTADAVHLTLAPNILDPTHNRQVTLPHVHNQPLIDYLAALTATDPTFAEALTATADDQQIIITSNGHLLHPPLPLGEGRGEGSPAPPHPPPLPPLTHTPDPGDHIRISIIPAGPVAAIAQSVLISSIVSLGTGLLINQLFGQPDNPTVDTSPTYAFSGISNRTGPGHTIPVGYGEHLVGGDIIAQFRREMGDPKRRSLLYILFCLGHGEYQEIAGQTEDTDNIDLADLTSEIIINGNNASLYKDAKAFVRMGSASQAAIPGFDETTVSQNVGIDLKRQDGALTVQTNADVDRFEININFPSGHRYYDDDGDVMAGRSRYRYRYRPVTAPATGYGDWVNVPTSGDFLEWQSGAFTITIRSGDLPAKDTYDIVVERTQLDDDEITGGSSITRSVLDSINEITDDGTDTYNGYALLGLTIPAQEQLSTPNPTVLVECQQRKIEIWDEVDPNYPSWNLPAYSRNPAWCVLDILKNATWGLGNLIDPAKHIDLQAFKDWADFCDELVNDGQAGTHKRHLTDVRLDTERSAWDYVRQIATSARGMVILQGQRITVKTMEAQTPVQVITMGSGNNFRIQYLGTRDRHNTLNVTYRDAVQQWAQETEIIQTAAAEAGSEPLVEKSIRMPGVTRQAEITRNAKMMLQAEQLQRRIIEFDIGVEALHAEAGDLITVATQVNRSGTSGRTATGSGASDLILDQDVFLETGHTYNIDLQHADDTIDTRIVDTAAGTLVPAGTAVSVSVAWSTVPADHLNYVLYSTTHARRDYVITRISVNPDFTRHVTALEYDANVYVDNPGTVTPHVMPPAAPGADIIPPDVTNLRAAFIGGNSTIGLIISWSHPTNTWAAGARTFIRQIDTTNGTGAGSWLLIADIPWPATTVTYWDPNNLFTLGDSWDIAVVTYSENGAAAAIDNAPSVNLAVLTAADLWVNNETPAGAIDATNDLYLLAWNPEKTNGMRLFLDGVLQLGPGTTDAWAWPGGIALTADAAPDPVQVTNIRTSYLRSIAPQPAADGLYECWRKTWGTGDGDNVTLPATPIAGTVMVWADGILQRITTDWTLAAAVLTFIEPPPVGAEIHVKFVATGGDRDDYATHIASDTYTGDGTTTDYTLTNFAAADITGRESYVCGLLLDTTYDQPNQQSDHTDAPPAGADVQEWYRDLL